MIAIARRLKNYTLLALSISLFLSRYGIFLTFADERANHTRVVISYNDVRRNRWDSIELTPLGSARR